MGNNKHTHADKYFGSGGKMILHTAAFLEQASIDKDIFVSLLRRLKLAYCVFLLF